MDRKRVMTVLMMVGFAVTTGWAQEAPQEESASADSTAREERSLSEDGRKQLEKISGQKDQNWKDFLVDWMTPVPVPKKTVVRIDEKYAYPHIAVSFKMEIVREEGDTVWLRGLSPEHPDSPLHPLWLKEEAWEIGYLTFQDEFKKPGTVNWANYEAEPVPPPFQHSLDFEEVAPDLPDKGRWQMGFTVADMNEDKHLDLVFPPQRKQISAHPSIFLGDGAGDFKYWQEAKWASQVPFDYGGVAVADFDGDGHQDIAVAIHFKAQYVLYGDGKGGFSKYKRLPVPDPRLTSRAVTAADLSGDGRPDLAFVAEIDYDLQTNARIENASTVWVVENQGSSWKLMTEGLPRNVMADVIRSADMDSDGRQDLLLSSNTLDWRRLIYFNRGADGWQAARHRGVLSAAYHYNVEPAGDQIFSTFLQFRLVDSKTQARNGLVRYPAIQAGEELEMGTPLVWDKERGDVFFRLATGDLNGDGRVDLVAGRRNGGLEVYVMSESGNLIRESSTSNMEKIGRAFSIVLVDIDRDGHDDIIASCAPQGERPGGVYAWLTREAD